jgi:hypothetical protein
VAGSGCGSNAESKRVENVGNRRRTKEPSKLNPQNPWVLSLAGANAERVYPLNWDKRAIQFRLAEGAKDKIYRNLAQHEVRGRVLLKYTGRELDLQARDGRGSRIQKTVWQNARWPVLRETGNNEEGRA